MLKRILLGLALVIVALALFLTRPWSAYSPLTMNTLFSENSRVENFRHMDRIFPSRAIKVSGEPFQFKRDEKPLNINYQFAGETRSVEDFLERVNTSGFIIIQDDTILFERYMNGAKETDTFTSWSVAKSVVSTLVGMALKDRKINSLDDAVTDYVPALNNTAYQGVPIKHILQMTSGVDFNEVYGEQFSDINRYFMKVFMLGRRANDVLADYGQKRASGQKFQYVSIDTQVLGLLVSTLYQQPLAKVVEARLWQPLGMEADAFWNIDQDSDDGVEIAFCCLNARLRDFARFGRLFLEQGEWNGEQLLPQNWVPEATTPSAPHLQPEQVRKGLRGYQYQWWVPGNPQREYFANGVWGQSIYVSEPQKLIIARNSVDPDFMPNMAEMIAVFRAIRDALD